MNRFEGRVALVTGAASGIGKATAQRLAGEGACVFCADIQAEVLARTVEELKAKGYPASYQVCDVSSEEDVKSTVAAAAARFDKLDVLCNIAGIFETSLTDDYSTVNWRRVMEVNLTGTFFMCREAIPHLLQTGGNIVNMSSRAGLYGSPYMAAYSASKAGILGLTYTIATEYAHLGLRANAVCPARIDTPMIANFKVPEGACEALTNRGSPPGAVFKGPETVASTIAFLASEDAAHINGAALPVDGGF